jgi:hypothetical protein
MKEEPYNGWILRNVYFEDGEPLMHSEPESTQSQELFGKTEKLEAKIKRLQELADYRLRLLTKMPSQWVGLTDEDRKDFYQGKYVMSDDSLMDAVEAKLKEKNHGTMGKMESN